MHPKPQNEWDQKVLDHLLGTITRMKSTDPRPYPTAMLVSSEQVWSAKIKGLELLLQYGQFCNATNAVIHKAPRNNVDGARESIVQKLHDHGEYFEGYCCWEFSQEPNLTVNTEPSLIRNHCWRVKDDEFVFDQTAMTNTPRSYFGIGFPQDFVAEFRAGVKRFYENINREIHRPIDSESTSIPIVCETFLINATLGELQTHFLKNFNAELWQSYERHVCHRFPEFFSSGNGF